MNIGTGRYALAGIIAAGLMASLPLAAQSAPMRIALGDLPGIESIQTLAAIERAKERGVEIELIVLNDEDLATQAIVGGQADVVLSVTHPRDL